MILLLILSRLWVEENAFSSVESEIASLFSFYGIPDIQIHFPIAIFFSPNDYIFSVRSTFPAICFFSDTIISDSYHIDLRKGKIGYI